VFGVGAVQFEFGLQGHAIGETAFDTLFDGIPGRVNEVIEELEYELVAGVRDREVLCEHLEKAFVLPVLGVGFELEELLERRQLDFEEIRVVVETFGGGEVNSLVRFLQRGSPDRGGFWVVLKKSPAFRFSNSGVSGRVRIQTSQGRSTGEGLDL